MKKLFTILFLLCSSVAIAQQDIRLNPMRFWFPVAIGKGDASSPHSSAWLDIGKDTSKKGVLLARGYKDSISNPKAALAFFDVKDSVLYIHDGAQWIRYMTRKDTAAMLLPYTRVTRFLDSLAGHRATLVHYQDTAYMLSPYTRVTRFLDSLANHRAALVHYQDTAVMLSPYTRVTRFLDSLASHRLAMVKYADTAAILIPYLRKADTSAMLAPYIRTIGLTPGTSGTDVNVSNSPVTGSGGTITLNIPSASQTARGLVTTGTQSFAGDKTLFGKWTVQTTTTPQRRLAYDGTNLIDESVASNGAITYNVQGSAPTYTYQIGGVTKVFISGTGQATYTATTEMIAQFGNSKPDKLYIVSGMGGQFADGSCGIMGGSSYVSTNPNISFNTQFGVANQSITIGNASILNIRVSSIRGNHSATSNFVSHLFCVPNASFIGQALIALFTNNLESGMGFNPSSGSNALTGVGSELRVRATGTWAGIARAFDVGFDASNTYANGTPVGYNYDYSMGIAFRQSNSGARNAWVGNSVFGSLTAGSEKVEIEGNLYLRLPGNKIKVATGSNASAGTAILSSGSVTVNTTAVTANSIIILTPQADGGTPGYPRVSTRTAGTSFTITSSSGTDASTIGYLIIN